MPCKDGDPLMPERWVWVGPMKIMERVEASDGFDVRLEQPQASCTPFHHMAAHSSLVIPHSPAIPKLATWLHEYDDVIGELYCTLLISTVDNARKANDLAAFLSRHTKSGPEHAAVTKLLRQSKCADALADILKGRNTHEVAGASHHN